MWPFRTVMRLISDARRRKQERRDADLVAMENSVARQIAAAERAQLADAVKRVMSMPVVKMTKEQSDALPTGVTRDFLGTCPLGTWVRCGSDPCLPDVVIAGQVVKGEDAILAQFGSGVLSVPERWINRYRVNVVPNAG